MKQVTNRIWTPVQREQAHKYLLYMLLSFAISVVGVRLFLELTGYPRIGSGELHIAHVLWGGLLLFVAAVAPLIFANRWVYQVGAVLSGAGVGLFIDEVGKFITQSNDYFYPLAAPIIYAFFLLIVLIYIQVRQPPNRNPREEMYRSLDGLMEIIDNDLDAREYAELEQRLQYVYDHANHPDVTQLAQALLVFIQSDRISIKSQNDGSLLEKIVNRLSSFEVQWISRPVLKTFLVAAMGFSGLFGLFQLSISLLALFSPETLERVATEIFYNEQQVRGAISLGWFIIRLLLEGAVGTMLLIASALLLVQRERWGLTLGYLGLLVSLTMVNLIVFYFDQFAAVSLTFIQFILLIAAQRYRTRFLGSPTVHEADKRPSS